MNPIFSQARWICAPDALLNSTPALRNPDFPKAPYLYGEMYIRQHLRRVFSLSADRMPQDAFASFSCENKFDLFLNGECISGQKSETGRVRIGKYLRPGENLLLLRIYQSADPDRFTSAITGGVRLTFADGKSGDLVTDENFHCLWLATFWEKREPENFASDPKIGREILRYTGTMHPRNLRRSVLFRKPFTVAKSLKRAVLRTTSRGMALYYCNGALIDDAFLSPGATEKRQEYREFDLTKKLLPGENVLGILTGNGWMNSESWGTFRALRNAVLTELELEYEDGSRELVFSGPDWVTALSGLADNDLQFGERYDARLEIPGWNLPSLTPDERWTNAALLPDAETALIPPLVLQSYPPVRAERSWDAHFLRELPAGSFPAASPAERAFLYQIDRNISGVVKLKLHSPKPGQRFSFYCCERLRPDGTPETGAYGAVVYPQDSLPGNVAQFNLRSFNQYIAKGEPYEEFLPRFTYTGLRYVILKGFEQPPDPADVEVLELHSDLARSGYFHCGDEDLNRIWDAVCQTWENNCFNAPTDCPTREKNFWNGDTQIFSTAACFITDNRDLLGSWTRYGRKMEPGVYGWEDETYILPYVLYRFYGDESVLRDCYGAMQELLRRREEYPGMLLPEHPRSPYNDWLNPTGVNLDPLFFSAIYYLHSLDLVSEIAAILGDAEKSAELKQRFLAGKKEFLKRYFDCASCRFAEHKQSAYALSLEFGLIPPELEEKTAKVLHDLLLQDSFQTTGFQGTFALANVLGRFGYGRTMLRLLKRHEFPSWLYMLDSGATCITESWYAMNDKDTSLSMSHFSMGACSSWFFTHLGGIDLRASAPGFRKLILSPHAYPEIGSFEVRFRTPQGEIRSAWKYVDGKAEFSYSAPDGIPVEFHPNA